MTILLVRHAIAMSRRRWDDDDELRPLTKHGSRQATAIVEQLVGYRVNAVYSSPAVRCIDTVTPLAAARGLPVHATELLAEGTALAGLPLLDEHKHVALCAHGDNLPELLLAIAGHLDSVPRQPSLAKGATWVLERRGGEVVEAVYLEPPA